MAYGVTACGALICFGMKRTMEKWVLLEADAAYCLAVHENVVICGCSKGIVRIFNALTLEFIASLPQHSEARVLAVQQADNCIMALFDDNSIVLWEVEIDDGKLVHCAEPRIIAAPQQPVRCITALPLSKDSNQGILVPI